jgi:hypothetical protein
MDGIKKYKRGSLIIETPSFVFNSFKCLDAKSTLDTEDAAPFVWLHLDEKAFRKNCNCGAPV